MELLDRLSPFMCRAQVPVAGRDRLYQLRNRLQFVLVAEEISEHSLQECLHDYPCPVYCALTMEEIGKHFGFRGTKVLGFKRHPLSAEFQAALKPFRASPRRAVPPSPRVAVLGASGIGRYHANWWRLEGARVTAFLGSSPERLAESGRVLCEQFGIEARGYTEFPALLSQETPDIVDVCLPPALHYEACRTALEAGCHVLCEKPYVFDESHSGSVMRSQARELMRLSRKKGALLGVCTQYVMAARAVLSGWRESHPGEPVRCCGGEIVSPAKGRFPVPGRTWIDLAPHLLGAVQVFLGDRIPDMSCPVRRTDGHLAELEAGTEDARVRIRVNHADTEPMNVRRLTLNDAVYEIGSERDADGVFRMCITGPEGELHSPDMLRLLIRSFLRGKAEVPPWMACRNMELLLTTLGWPDERPAVLSEVFQPLETRG